MTADEIYNKIIADLQLLHLDSYDYLSGGNSLRNMSLDISKGYIYVFRGEKRIPLNFNKLKAAALAFATLNPVDFNNLFASSGNSRTVLETLLSYLPNIAAAADKSSELPSNAKVPFYAEMLLLFELLREHNLEFGYRTAYEAARFIRFFHQLGGYTSEDSHWFTQAMDAVVIQKILPKLHGSRTKMEGLLWALIWFCGANRDEHFTQGLAAASKADDDTQYSPDLIWAQLAKHNLADPAAAARYPMSFAKVMRMWRRLIREQFVTFTEA
jgi:hypothetical protein